MATANGSYDSEEVKSTIVLNGGTDNMSESAGSNINSVGATYGNHFPGQEPQPNLLQPKANDGEESDGSTILEYYYPEKSTPNPDQDEDCLAAKDSLALEEGRHPMAMVPADHVDEEENEPEREILSIVKKDNGEFDEYEEDARKTRRIRGICLTLCLLIVVLVVILAVVLPDKGQQEGSQEPVEAFLEGSDNEVPVTPADDTTVGTDPTTTAPGQTPEPTPAPTFKSQTTEEYKILENLVSNPPALLNMTTPQGLAFDNLLNDGLTDSFRIQQRYAMYVLYYSTGGKPINPGGGDNGGRRLQTSWSINVGWQTENGDVHQDECGWYGVGGCRQVGPNRVVSELNLPLNNMVGVVPDDLCLLSGLEKIDVSGNSLNGVIPACLAALPRLSYIALHGNNLEGSLDTFCTVDHTIESLTADCDLVVCPCCTECP